MFYVFSHTPSAQLTEATAVEEELKLCAGIIHQVDILFQDGCKHNHFVQIFQGGHQLWPSNTGEKMRGNATVISFREFQELEQGENILSARVWSTASSGWKEIIINIGILPRRIIQPLSFDELLSAATGVK